MFWVSRSVFANGISNNNEYRTAVTSKNILNTWNRCLAPSKIYNEDDCNDGDIWGRLLPSGRQKYSNLKILHTIIVGSKKK